MDERPKGFNGTVKRRFNRFFIELTNPPEPLDMSRWLSAFTTFHNKQESRSR